MLRFGGLQKGSAGAALVPVELLCRQPFTCEWNRLGAVGRLARLPISTALAVEVPHFWRQKSPSEGALVGKQSIGDILRSATVPA